MPAGLGDIMVVVRAQDFASRTLRRVSGELAGLSRQQALAYQGQMVQYQKGNAIANMAMAQSDARRLSYIGERNALRDQVQALNNYQRASKAALATPVRGPGGRFARSPELEAARRGLEKYGVATTQVGQMLSQTYKHGRTMEEELARMNTRINEFEPGLRRASTTQGAFSNALYKSRMRLANATAALNDAQIAELQFNAAVKAMPVNRLHDVAAALSGIGRTMQLWGAVGVGILGLTSAAYANFSRQVTLAATQTRQAGQSFLVTARNSDVLQRAILQMMTKFPASAQDMSQAAYDIYSSIDVSFGNGIKLLRMFNKVAVAGQVDLATATKAGVAILSNFDKQLTDHNKITGTTTGLMNLMFATVRYGFMTFQEYAQMLVSVIPAATNAQQKMEDVAGAMAMATRIMPASASRAATALSRLLDVFTWPDFQAGMAKLGASITYLDDTGKKHLLPFMDIMERLYDVVTTGKVPLNRIIQLITQVGRGQGMGREATMQARRLLGPMIAQMETLRRVQREVLGDTNEFDQAYKAMAQTLGVRWQVMLNQYKVLILSIGEEALPVMLKIGEYIGKWIEKWRKLDEATRSTIVRWAAIVSVGTLILGVVLAVIGVFATLAANLMSFAIKLGVAQEGGEGLLGRLTTLLTTLRGIAGIGAITVGISLMLNKEGIDPWVGALLTGVGAKLLSGRAGVGLGVGSIAIGIELFRKGGNWQYLGELLAIAGLFGMRRGLRGGVTAATVAVGVQLVMQGGGWNTLIGSALLAIGAGAATGQPIVIPVVFAASISFSWINEAEQKRKARQAAIDTLNAYKQQLQGLRDAGIKVPDYLFQGIDQAMKGRPWGKAMTALMAISPFQANRKWDQEAVDAASRQAKKYIAAWEKEMKGSKWWKDVQAAPANQVYRGLGDYKPPNLKKPLDDAQPSVRALISATKVWTLNQAAVNDLIEKANNAYKQTASSAEIAVTKIASAMTHGNIQVAMNLIDQFIATSNKKIGWADIGKEIQKAVNSGDIQGAAQILNQFVQDVNSAAEAMKQWQKDMKDWQDRLNESMTSAASQTLETLRTLYGSIASENERLMGDLFKGPWLTSQTFDLAKEWGITPRIEDIIKDMRMQGDAFAQERKLIDQAMRKKIPKGFLDELKKMTPEEAMPILKELVNATPKQIQQLINQWNRRQGMIKNATKLDFTNQIKAYRRAGVNMGQAMIDGFKDAGVGKWFDAWVKKQFPTLIDQAVAEAVNRYKKENPVPEKPTGVGGGGGEAPTAPPQDGKGKTQQPPVYRGGSAEPPTTKAPKVPAPIVDYGAYKKAGVLMGNSIVRGFHSVRVAREIQVNFVPEIIRYNANGRSMGTALGKGVIFAWNKQVPQIQQVVLGVNWNESIIAFNSAGKRLGNAMILGFKQAKVGLYFRTWINETFPKLIEAATTEAVNKWKKEHKETGKPGGVAGSTTNNTTNNTSTDNRIIITVPESVGPHVKSNARYVAWLAKHHIRPNQVVST